jgi:hypothetical protein
MWKKTLLVVFVGCSSKSSQAPAPTNGVDDVLKACEIRATWLHGTSTECNTCIGVASAPRCACENEDYAGKCSDQVQAKSREATCDDALTACIANCARTDCGCINGCYSGRDACRVVASAVDGCLAEECDSICR